MLEGNSRDKVGCNAVFRCSIVVRRLFRPAPYDAATAEQGIPSNCRTSLMQQMGVGAHDCAVCVYSAAGELELRKKGNRRGLLTALVRARSVLDLFRPIELGDYMCNKHRSRCSRLGACFRAWFFVFNS